MGTVAVTAAAHHSAKAGAVVRALAPRLGLTPGSAHQHLQRIRRELPLVLRTAWELERQAWADWFFAPLESERGALLGGRISADLQHILAKGSVDRCEDSAREAYLATQDTLTAREFDLRLEREQMAIAAARRFLRLRHPELVR